MGFWFHPKIRAFGYQLLLVCMISIVGWYLVSNLLMNLRMQGIASGFDFLKSTAGFGIVMHLIPYDESSSYGAVFLVGLGNTLIVSVIGIFFATILGFAAGISRLSQNYLLSKCAGAFVEVMRNIPLLLLIFFIYFGVLRNLPEPSASLNFANTVFLNNRGLYLPTWAHDAPGGWSFPVFESFDFVGGMVIIPEFVALTTALALYTAGFIAEIVRAGILSVSKGQIEAAMSLGLSDRQSLRLIILPQAMRVIIPPLASQFLNLVKNSTLAAAIGYPDLVQVFAGTVLSQTGQAVEIILITMAVYLTICLSVSLFMNAYNRRSLIFERTTG